MIEKFFDLYTTMYHLASLPVRITPAGWLIAGMILTGIILLYFYAKNNVLFFFWASAIRIVSSLAFLEVGAIIVVLCRLAQASRFQLEASFLTVPLAMIAGINFGITKYVLAVVAAIAEVFSRMSTLSKRLKLRKIVCIKRQ